jgi:TPR repeat protein
MRSRLILLLFGCMVFPLSGCIETFYHTGDFLVDATKLQPWKKLALDGDVEAQYKVGEMYCCGDRPKYDNVRALHWYCQAARQNQRDAQHKVGWMYEHAADYKGNIVPANPVLAHVYYTLAAQGGNKEAPKALAKMTPLSTEQMKEALALLEEWPAIACEVSR